VRGLGWLPDPSKLAGQRPDLIYQATRAAPPPPAHSLDDLVVDVLDQGQLSSCSANAAMQAVRMRHVAQGVARPILGSRLFAYYFARAADHATSTDSGATLRGIFDGMAKLGWCPETAWPYVETDGDDPRAPFRTMPPTGAFRAAHDCVMTYRRISGSDADRIAGAKAAIVEGLPVVFGCGVDQAFITDAFDASQALPPPAKPVGQHAMVITGYTGDTFQILSSWSSAWGDGGFCIFSAEYLATAGDLWVLDAVHPPETS
jgi:C1A family cysteine protease